MMRKLLFALWGVLFSLCAGLGFIPEPGGIMDAVLTGVALLCFLPPSLLLYLAGKAGSHADILLIRNLSALSLGLTLTALIANFFTAFASEAVGQIFYYILIIVSSPMVCSGHWAMSLFLWACLMIVSIRQLKR